MNIKTQDLFTTILYGKPKGFIVKTEILPGEIKGVVIEYISAKGPCKIDEPFQPGLYKVLLSLKGDAGLFIRGKKYAFNAKSISRIPFNEQFSIHVKPGIEFYFLSFKKQMDNTDIHIISKSSGQHSFVYIKTLSDCPVYREDIKSSKTISRMILPEGYVPRFCMGSVETEGPDIVAEHKHPMLDQLFLGLDNCKCSCIADGEKALLTENKMMHIPLGSKHSVSVAEGDILAYIWIDFFFTLEGQKYMEDQHQIVRGKIKLKDAYKLGIKGCMFRYSNQG